MPTTTDDINNKHIINANIECITAAVMIKRELCFPTSTCTVFDRSPISDISMDKIAYFKEVANIKLLESYALLKDNWNGTGANTFSRDFIDFAIGILLKLDQSPMVFPTGRSSVQFEYEKQNGDYLEFEIFENKEILCFKIKNGIESNPAANTDNLNQILEEFYAV